MNFIDENSIKNKQCEDYPFKHIVIDNFFKEDQLNKILENVNNLKNKNAQIKRLSRGPQFNKFGFNKDFNEYLKQIFVELNSDIFIKFLEDLTGIKDIIRNEINLVGAGIHRIKRHGYLKLHTDFNTCKYKDMFIDRRINILIYLNSNWKDEYHGELCLCDYKTKKCIKKINPILNRCVIFTTNKKSIHGHPTPLNTPENVFRQSIAVYYYTKNLNYPNDFEGDDVNRGTTWYKNIKV